MRLLLHACQFRSVVPGHMLPAPTATSPDACPERRMNISHRQSCCRASRYPPLATHAQARVVLPRASWESTRAPRPARSRLRHRAGSRVRPLALPPCRVWRGSLNGRWRSFFTHGRFRAVFVGEALTLQNQGRQPPRFGVTLLFYVLLTLINTRGAHVLSMKPTASTGTGMAS